VIEEDDRGPYVVATTGERVPVERLVPLQFSVRTVMVTSMNGQDVPQWVDVTEALAVYAALSRHWYTRVQSQETELADLRACLTQHGIPFRSV